MAKPQSPDQTRTSRGLSIFQRLPFYLRCAASGTKWLSFHFINLFWDEYRQCSCLKSSKRACKHQAWKAARSCLVHIPALSLTAFVLYINFSQIYWEDVGAPMQNVRFNLLQLAAKVLEMFVVASISCVIVNHIQYALLHGRGLSLGIVLAGFQATTLTSFFDPSLWRKLSTKGFRERRYLFILLLLVLIILCAVVGPSCAIVTLPSIDWWPDKRSFFPENRYFIDANESVLWPTHVTVENTFPAECSLSNASLVNYCPASGLSAIRDTILSGRNLYWRFQVVNITLPVDEPAGPPKFHRSIEACYATYPDFNNTDPDGIARNLIPTFVAASNSIIVNYFVGRLEQATDHRLYDNNRMEILLHDARKTFVPRVLTQCTTKEEQTRLPNHPLEGVDPPNSAPTPPLSFLSNPAGENWAVDARAYLGKSKNASIWVNSQDLGGSATMPSIAIVATYSYPDSYAKNELKQNSVLLACSIYASWEPITLYLDIGRRSFDSPEFPSLVSYNDTAGNPFDPRDFKLQNMFKPASVGSKPILIDVDWANLMLPPNETIEVLRQAFDDNQPFGGVGHQVITSVPAFSLLLVDALARIGMGTTKTLGSSEKRAHNFEDSFLDFDDVVPFSDVDLQKSTEMVIELTRFGYSYSTRGTTRYISVGILLAYVTITLIHIVLILWFRWSCTDLGSLYDLVNLAFISSRSLPDEVVTFGLAELKKENVNVRAEEQEHSELRMVVDGLSRRDTKDDPKGLARQRR